MQIDSTITYKDAGVDIVAAEDLIKIIKPLAKRTIRPEVLQGIGGFAALFELGKKYHNPVLVSGTDGVGTKLKLAVELNCHHTIGQDLVAMSVNDILVQGAEPLFFLDYFACGKLDVNIASAVIKGISDGCLLAGCSLIGGETAEMPDMYPQGEYDLAGFALGVVEKDAIVDGHNLALDDVIIGIASRGIHSNGYSLVRKLITMAKLDLNSAFDQQSTWGQILLTPTKIYAGLIKEILLTQEITAMAHITGGGISNNLIRVIKDGLCATINLIQLPQTKLFQWIQNVSALNQFQMLATFNCGIGFIIICKAQEENKIREICTKHQIESYHLGKITQSQNHKIEYI